MNFSSSVCQTSFQHWFLFPNYPLPFIKLFTGSHQFHFLSISIPSSVLLILVTGFSLFGFLQQPSKWFLSVFASDLHYQPPIHKHPLTFQQTNLFFVKWKSHHATLPLKSFNSFSLSLERSWNPKGWDQPIQRLDAA